jgi:DNA-binding NtrC family response regulator
VQTNGNSPKEAAREPTRQAEHVLILKHLERTHWNWERTPRELQIICTALLNKVEHLSLDGSGNSREP